jgi:hypothetical protein
MTSKGNCSDEPAPRVSSGNCTERIPAERAPWGQFPSWLGMSRAVCTLLDAGTPARDVCKALRISTWGLALMRETVRRSAKASKPRAPSRYRGRGR